MLRSISLLACFICCIAASSHRAPDPHFIVAGTMPNLTRDANNVVHLVFGRGDSIMYASSKDGMSFSSSSLIAVLPGVFTSAMRGPQVAAVTGGLVVTACTKNGDIYSFTKRDGVWKKTARVNDKKEVAKEALLATAADGLNVFTVFLGVTGAKGQAIYGARSADGGQSWKKNVLVYASPDSTVCECCKPSVAMKGTKVAVMFRNWISGSRDLHLVQSSNGGQTFAAAQKLGQGTWMLKGCPMDGGGLVLNNNTVPQTVWNRKGVIYAAQPGRAEEEVGSGRHCTLESTGGKNVYAWVDNGSIVVKESGGIKSIIGKGSGPVLKALGANRVLCVWERDKNIEGTVITIGSGALDVAVK